MAGGAVARSASTKLEALQSQLRHTEELMSTMSPPSKSSTEVADRGDSSKSPGGRDPREARRLQWLKAADAGASSFFEHLYQQEKAEPLFAELGGLMDCSDEEGNTALHRAATLGHAKSVEWLVRQGANLQAKNHSGETPIDVATPDVLRALGQTAGADEGVPPAEGAPPAAPAASEAVSRGEKQVPAPAVSAPAPVAEPEPEPAAPPVAPAQEDV